jgi:CBS domain-containing membrane protein
MVLGGSALKLGGAFLPVLPIALNSIILVVLGYCFHRLSRRSYPHVATPVQPINEHRTRDAAPQQRVGVVSEDVDAALATLGQTFDIDRRDLNLLLGAAEQHALSRLHGTLLCKDILSRDVISISEGTSVEQARNLLLAHNIRTLPVIDDSGKMRGVVGLRELALGNQTIDRVTAPATTALEDDTAISLLPILSDGHTHAVIIVDHRQHIVGIITQSDMLASLGRLLLNAKP